MKKLNKEQAKQLTDLVSRLRDARTVAEEAFASAHLALIEAFNDYSAIVDEAVTFRDEIVSAMDDYVGERSEKWQESDAASTYEDWKSEWENVEMDLQEPVEHDFDEACPDVAEALEALPVEAQCTPCR